MRILIGADLVPTQKNMELFSSGNVQALLGEGLTETLQSADFRIFNLEVPFADAQSPIPKCGPNLIAPTSCVQGFQAMKVDLLTLANNHILDQGQQGLESTVRALDQAGIAYVGTGNNPEEASKPYIIVLEGKKIGVYACVEHEFSVVTDHSAGANPIDPLESPDHVAALKAECDYVIVLYHGGKECYRYPSPNLQKVCRKLVEKGADLVLCQHSHCVGCQEQYQGGTIVYGQGNFLFDIHDNEYYQTGLLVQIGENFKIDYIPLVKQGETVRLAEGQTADDILEGFRKRSEEIKDGAIIRAKYQAFALQCEELYLLSFAGVKDQLVFRILNKLSGYRFAKWYIRHHFSKTNRLALLNYMDCEAHRELAMEALSQQ